MFQISFAKQKLLSRLGPCRMWKVGPSPSSLYSSVTILALGARSLGFLPAPSSSLLFLFPLSEIAERSTPLAVSLTFGGLPSGGVGGKGVLTGKALSVPGGGWGCWMGLSSRLSKRDAIWLSSSLMSVSWVQSMYRAVSIGISGRASAYMK